LVIGQNNCLDFENSSNNYVSVSSFPLFGSGVSFTYSAWINSETPATGGWQGIIYHGAAGGSQGHLGINPSGYLSGGTGDGSDWQTHTTSYLIPQDKWVFVTMTLNRSTNTCSFYVNGVLIQSYGHSYVPSATSDPLTISLGAGGEYFDGKIDEVRIWNDVRTEDEIRNNMYCELPGPAGETNLVAYYRFNETSGTTLNDSKASYDGTLNNMSGNEWQTSPAIFGPKYALDFDGINDYVNCGSVNLSGSTLTLECWINADNFDNPGEGCISLIGTEESGSSAFMRLGDGGTNMNKVQFVLEISGQKKLWASTGLSANTWYHVAGVYDAASGMKIYINGVLDASNTQSGSVTSNHTFLMGSNTNGNRAFDGEIDEARAWNIAQTATEIRENMMKCLTGNETGLAAYYTFDNNTGITLPDISGNGNDGTLTNMDNSDWVSSSAFNTWLNTSSSSWSETTNWSLGSNLFPLAIM